MRVKKDAFQEFPSKMHDKWVSQDGDVIVVGDVFDNINFNRIPKSKLLYTDPPWGQPLSMYRNMVGFQPQTFDVFVEELAKRIKEYGPDYAFVEMGNKWVDKVVGAFRDVGMAPELVYPIFYSRVHPGSLIQVRVNSDVSIGFIDAVRDRDDNITPGVVMDVMKSDSVFDTCLGLGATARNAWERKMKLYGVELVPERLAYVLRVGRDKFGKVWTKEEY